MVVVRIRVSVSVRKFLACLRTPRAAFITFLHKQYTTTIIKKMSTTTNTPKNFYSYDNGATTHVKQTNAVVPTLPNPTVAILHQELDWYT